MKRSDATFSTLAVLVSLLALWPIGRLVQSEGLLDSYVVRIILLIGIRITAAVSLQLINGISGQFSLGHAGFMAIGAYIAAYSSLHHSEQLTRPFSILAFFVAAGAAAAAVAALLYAVYRVLVGSRRLHGGLPAVLTVGLVTWFIADLAMAPASPSPFYLWSWSISATQQLFATTLGVLLPLGAKLSALMPAVTTEPLSYVILLAGGGLFAAGAGLIVGIPALRLRGDYLAIATLGFAEIVRVLLESSAPFGRALGLTGIPHTLNFAWIYGIAIVTIVCIWRLVHSARGRAMLAVREDEIAAASVGIDPARSKVLAFVIGAFFAGVSGVALAHYEGYLTPANFAFMQSVELVVIVTLAGAGSISGTILVAAVLTWLPEQLRSFAEYRMILYSVLLIVLMLTRPKGILGSREVFAVRRKGSIAA